MVFGRMFNHFFQLVMHSGVSAKHGQRNFDVEDAASSKGIHEASSKQTKKSGQKVLTTSGSGYNEKTMLLSSDDEQ